MNILMLVCEQRKINPDERQNHPNNQPICDKYGIEDCFYSELNLENMLSHLVASNLQYKNY
jgi:hypothetical protein